MKKIKYFIQTHRHGILLLYLPFYLLWFFYLEQAVTDSFHPVHLFLDDYIPFVEYFVIPYDLWFFYLGSALIFFFLKNTEDFKKMCAFLFTGMTIFLIISTVYPNGHHLRPDTFSRDNLCVKLVQLLYSSDTPTNLFPSIHVYDSVGVHLAICQSSIFKKKPALRAGSFLLMISIILSTIFIKQHSLFDVITALLLAIVMYKIIYCPARQPIHIFARHFPKKL